MRFTSSATKPLIQQFVQTKTTGQSTGERWTALAKY